MAGLAGLLFFLFFFAMIFMGDEIGALVRAFARRIERGGSADLPRAEKQRLEAEIGALRSQLEVVTSQVELALEASERAEDKVVFLERLLANPERRNKEDAR